MSNSSIAGKFTRFARVVAALTLIGCLLFLTSLNYFAYPSEKATAVHCHQHDASDDDAATNNPAGPSEEKCSSGITLIEEFLHDSHPAFDFGALDQQYRHNVAGADRIEVFHGERFSPPPEF